MENPRSQREIGSPLEPAYAMARELRRLVKQRQTMPQQSTAVQPSQAADRCITAHVLAIVSSAGSLAPLRQILKVLPVTLPAAVVVLMHRLPGSVLAEVLRYEVKMPVRDAVEGDCLQTGSILLAPGGVHMTVDHGGRVRLLATPKLNHTRPSADLLLPSLADTYGERLTAVVLSGMGADGTAGSRAVRAAGGVVIAQDQSTAAYPDMPTFATDMGKVDLVLRVEQIAPAVCALVGSD
jgi:two-component system chemotaxis response regulator CheB